MRVFYLHPHDQDGLDHRRFVLENIEGWLFWAAANFLVSWILGFIIDIIPGIFTWLIFFTWGRVSETMKSRVEMYQSVKGTVKPLFYAAASWVSWVIIFAHIYNLYDIDNESQSRASYTPRVSRGSIYCNGRHVTIVPYLRHTKLSNSCSSLLSLSVLSVFCRI